MVGVSDSYSEGLGFKSQLDFEISFHVKTSLFICWMLPLATHCHIHYHLHPFHFVLFKSKIGFLQQICVNGLKLCLCSLVLYYSEMQDSSCYWTLKNEPKWPTWNMTHKERLWILLTGQDNPSCAQAREKPQQQPLQLCQERSCLVNKGPSICCPGTEWDLAHWDLRLADALSETCFCVKSCVIPVIIDFGMPNLFADMCSWLSNWNTQTAGASRQYIRRLAQVSFT